MKSFLLLKRNSLALLLVSSIGQLCPNRSLVFAGPLDEWTLRSPSPHINGLAAAAFGSGMYVAVGDGGALLTSTDALNWSIRDSKTSRRLYSVAFGALSGNIASFVAVGNTIVTSNDGINWTNVIGENRSQSALEGVAIGNGVAAAVGIEAGPGWYGTIMYSPNGNQWTNANVEISLRGLPLSGVAFGNGQFVAVGDQGAILTSNDGRNWAPSPSSGGVKNSLLGVTYGNGSFVAVGANGAVLVSKDGIVWNYRESGVTDNLVDVSFGNGSFIAVTAGSGAVLRSVDGASWLEAMREANGSSYPPAVDFGKDRFLFLNFPNDKQSSSIWISKSGETWETSVDTSATHSDIVGVVFGNDRFVAADVEGRILISANGRDWARFALTPVLAPGRFRIEGLTFANGLFVVFGADQSYLSYSGTILTSTDGTEWTQRIPTGTPNGTGRVTAVSFDKQLFYASASGLEFLRSTDGLNWGHMPVARLPDSEGRPNYGFAANNGILVVQTDVALLTMKKKWHRLDLIQAYWGLYPGQQTFARGG